MLEHIETYENDNIRNDFSNQFEKKIEIISSDTSSIISNQNLNNNQFKKLFQEWCEVSTTHGIPQIARAKNNFLKLMWLIFFIICSSVCVFNILTTFADFLNYKVNVDIETINEYQTQFPAVSFCNLNPFKTGDNEIKNDLESMINDNMILISEAKSSDMKIKVSQAILKLNISKLKPNPYGFKLADLLIGCYFNSYPCAEDDFEEFYDFDYGNCFKFNGNQLNVKNSYMNGPKSGLRLELFIGNSSQDEPYIDRRGIRLVIHNQTFKSNNDHFVDFDTKGIDISPGFLTNLAIKRTFYHRYNQPTGKCVDDLSINYKHKTKMMQQMFFEYNISVYLQNLCFKYAFQRYFIEFCNCSDPSLKMKQSCKSAKDLICLEEKLSKFGSVSTINKSIEIEFQNECPLECSSVEYDIKPSRSTVLTKWSLNLIKDDCKKRPIDEKQHDKNMPFHEKHKCKILDNFENIDEVRKSLVFLNIYYDNLGYTAIVEEPMYDLISFLSNIGGHLGLFVGMSFLSLIEILEIIVQLIIIIFKKSNKIN